MILLLRLSMCALVLVAAVPAAAQEREAESSASQSGWVIDASRAATLIGTGNVTVLDARPARSFARAHVPGAVHVDWTTFSQTAEPNRGKLLETAELQAAIRATGVRVDRPVVVVGAPPYDWGEDGRIVWMLRAAGHTAAGFVDGGHKALVRAGVKMTTAKTVVMPGDFVVTWSRKLTAVRDDLLRSGAVILDTREPREYRGATPYGESRGGHVEGAQHLYFRDLLRRDGTLRTVGEIRARLAALGAVDETPIIAYCTGGVRSGWMVAVLQFAGFHNVSNYAGSMWDWAAAPTGQYPLVR